MSPLMLFFGAKIQRFFRLTNKKIKKFWKLDKYALLLNPLQKYTNEKNPNNNHLKTYSRMYGFR